MAKANNDEAISVNGNKGFDCGSGARRVRVLLSSLFCSTLFLIGLVKGEVRYTLTELWDHQSWDFFGNAINNCGEVVGNYDLNEWDPLATRSFIFRAGRVHDLGTISGFNNLATAINDYGQVVGYFDNGFTQKGYLHRTSGEVVDLGALSGATLTEPLAINDAGVIVGYSGEWAFRYQNGKMSAFGTYSGYPIVSGVSINNSGQTLLWYQRDDFSFGTLIYSGGHMHDIGIPGGGKGNTFGSYMNDRGIILGTYIAEDGTWGNFIYRDGKFRYFVRDGRTLNAISNRGVIVGYKNIGLTENVWRAIITDGVKDEFLNNLIDPKLGVRLLFATGINDLGQISATGINATGVEVGYLLTPIRRCR